MFDWLSDNAEVGATKTKAKIIIFVRKAKPIAFAKTIVKGERKRQRIAIEKRIQDEVQAMLAATGVTVLERGRDWYRIMGRISQLKSVISYPCVKGYEYDTPICQIKKVGHQCIKGRGHTRKPGSHSEGRHH